MWPLSQVHRSRYVALQASRGGMWLVWDMETGEAVHDEMGRPLHYRTPEAASAKAREMSA